MSATTKKAIIRALLDGVMTDLWPKTTGEQVILDDSTTLSAKLAEFIVALNDKATAAALSNGLASKADKTHEHDQSEIAGLETALAGKASTTALSDAIASLRTELMGTGVPEAYDTFKELADYIAAHQNVADSLNSAIGSKADKSTVNAIQAIVNALGDLSGKDEVSESDLDAALLAKVNAASQGNHSHANKALLDTYTQTNANLADAVSKKHSHTNASILNAITADKVAAWDGKSRVLVGATQPSDMAAGDLWFQIIE